MPIYHVLRLRFKPETPAETIDRLYEQLQGFRDLASPDAVYVGRNLRSSDYHIGAVVVLRDEQAFQEYLYEPIHLALDRTARPHVEAAEVFDLSDDDSAGLSARLEAMSLGREQDEELEFDKLGNFPRNR